LDLHRRAESRGDKVLIFASTLFLSAECACELMELFFFSFHKRHSHLMLRLMDIVTSLASCVRFFFENEKMCQKNLAL
jgi:hypothetical protein